MLKFAIIPVLSLLAISNLSEAKNNSPDTLKFEDFKDFHRKQYMSATHESNSKAIFQRNAADVAAHNQAFKEGKVTYTKELNQFADIDPVEFRKRNGSKPPMNATVNTRKSRAITKRNRKTPASLDWRRYKKVSPVKDQGQCGSCWSFSTTGAMESQMLIHGRKLQTLSEQFLVSCDTNDDGCGGGWYTRAWQYIQSVGGIVSESTLPYESTSGTSPSCPDQAPNNYVASVGSFQEVGNDDESIKAALYQYGPLSVVVDAQNWQLASDGIYSCGNYQVDHAILLVGYGTDRNGRDYWILKNSWGTGWGDKGFFYVARGKGDCGVSYDPAYVQLA